MANEKDLLTRVAQGYRQFWNDHPVAAIGTGFIPVIGTVLGAADAAAAYADPEAPDWEKALSTAGLLPFARGAVKTARAARRGDDLFPGMQIAAGPRGREALENVGAGGKIIRTENVPGFGEVSEIMDPPTNRFNLRRADPNKNPNTTVGVLEPDMDTLYEAYPGLEDVPVELLGKKATDPDFIAGAWRPPKSISQHVTHGDISLKHLPQPLVDYLTEVAKVGRHEIGHAIQFLERQAGNWSDIIGASPARVGYVGYGISKGEILTNVGSMYRANWPEALRREIPLSTHLKAEQMRIGLATKKGMSLNAHSDVMDRPDVVKQLAERYDREGIPQEALDLWEKGPNWEVPPISPRAPAGTRNVAAGELMQVLDPSGALSRAEEAARGKMALVVIRPKNVTGELLPEQITAPIRTRSAPDQFGRHTDIYISTSRPKPGGAVNVSTKEPTPTAAPTPQKLSLAAAAAMKDQPSFEDLMRMARTVNQQTIAARRQPR